MDWSSSVWLTCERGVSTAFWAEPVNAASNIIYFIVAVAALHIYRRLPIVQKSADHLLLIGLVFLIGLGGVLFHLFANQWSEMFHMVPVVLFFMVYLAYAMNRFLEVPPGWVGVLTGLFVLLTIAALTMTCAFLDQSLQPSWTKDGATSCLNGSGGHLPALLSVALVGYFAYRREHKAASSLLLASAVFIVALFFHTIDHYFCNQTVVMGHNTGSHFLWHILNGVMLFVLLRTSLIHQNVLPVQEIILPDRGDRGSWAERDI
jgi:hypothetical protein